jgi:hypothetical protein
VRLVSRLELRHVVALTIVTRWLGYRQAFDLTIREVPPA